jgi:hypothetical protein
MKWLRISLTEDEQRVVMSERESYPDPLVRRKLWTLWLLHCGTTREKAARIVGVARYNNRITLGRPPAGCDMELNRAKCEDHSCEMQPHRQGARVASSRNTTWRSALQHSIELAHSLRISVLCAR